MNSEYTAEDFDQEVVDERIAILLATWGYTAEDEDNDAYAYADAQQRAYDLAVSFPSQISDELFAEYVEEGLVA